MGRYQVIEADGKWFVVNMQYPDIPFAEYKDKKLAETDCRIWNILVEK